MCSKNAENHEMEKNAKQALVVCQYSKLKQEKVQRTGYMLDGMSPGVGAKSELYNSILTCQH